ncbi:UDP-glucose/GDP-mannose dehydrogenase family protein [Alphaproteobacteria bacterium]|nr:UDP-glucose/GDP-mannose dehydrogenase family protein [Alphaproteobacteria bacterium]MDC3269843.1 UDP-glucose/GDP-mannose dehydrogenase family protein [Alphaproteobacteria bacterium]
MKLAIIGTGYVGLITGACFAEFGYQTVCIDKDEKRVKELNDSKSPFYEPGIEALLDKHLNKTKLLSFSDSLSQSINNADIIFITVGTPSKRIEGEADLSFVLDVAEEISNNISKYCIVVTKSTVPVGTTTQVKNIISKKIDKKDFDVVSNPEFLREGSAINDFMRPDRVVIGCENKKSEDIMKELYRPLYLLETPIVSTTVESAEIIKYASNSFLATKISFINQVADLCEKVGADVQDVAKGMGIDKRIGNKFLHAGPGYGGSCFPKDVKAFIRTAQKHEVDLSILSSVDTFNEERISKITNKFISKTNLEKGDQVSLLGLSFKPNTDDVRDSTSLKIAKLLQAQGVIIKSYDPEAMDNAKKENTELQLCDSAYEACVDTKAIIIGTEWNEFRALDFQKIKASLKNLVIFDLRNIYNPKEIKDLGFTYFGTGK